MPVNEFVALNPAHNRPVIKSDTPMVIPADRMDAFESNLEAHEERKQPLSSWRAYTVRPGDKLEKIAPRFGMSVANLKSVNGIQGKIRVAPGLTLLVPGKGDDVPLDAPALSQPEISAAPAARSEVRTHIVAKGETLATIARRFGLSAAELQRINHLRGIAVKPGTRLVVSTNGTGAKTPAKLAKSPEAPAGAKARAASAASQPARRSPKITHHTVRSGETLASIARRYKVGIDDLRRWNPASTSALKPGTQLTIQLAQNPCSRI
jgi:membrane-bound lytic murein transglycosylase D